MWQRFTERARRVVFFAQEEAGRLGENYVSTEHLLLGLVRENDSVAARILDRMGVSLGRIRSEIERQVLRGEKRKGQDKQLTPRAKRVIELAYDEARLFAVDYIGTQHLLLGLIREGEGLAGRVLTKLGVDLETTRELVRQQQGANQEPPAAAPQPHSNPREALFADQFVRLPAEQQAALTGDGLAFNALPAIMQKSVQAMLTAGIKGHIFFFSPNALVRVTVTKIEGATHYTVTTDATFFMNFLAKDA